MDGRSTQREFYKQLKEEGIKLLHFLLSVAVFYLFWILFRYETLSPQKTAGFRYNYFIALGYGVLLLFFIRTYNGYLLGYYRIRDLAVSEFVSQFFSAALVYFAVSIAWNHWKSCWIFIPMLLVLALLDILWALAANEYYFKLHPPKNTLLIYRNQMDRKRIGNVRGKPTDRLYRISKEIMFDGDFFELRDRLAGYEAVIVAGVNSDCRNGILKYCKETGVSGFFLPHVGDVIMQDAVHTQSFDSPLLFVSRSPMRPEYRIAKRLFDLLFSGIGLLLLSPVMLATALAIRLHDRGPVLYKQLRLTKDGKTFQILKFRSMRVDAEKDGIARLCAGDTDDRITPVGKRIRKYRLDELPQLFNVLRGDMSIVGPRPERPEIADQYYDTIPEFKLRLQVKAGLTGYAQVYGKYNTDPYEKLEFDLLYINHMSLLTDLSLVFATLFTLFNRESTQGVGEGRITAIDPEDNHMRKIVRTIEDRQK